MFAEKNSFFSGVFIGTDYWIKSLTSGLPSMYKCESVGVPGHHNDSAMRCYFSSELEAVK